VIHSVIDMSAPFLIAALGGLFTERAGVLNIALEGLMLIGAFTAAMVAGTSGSITAAVAAAAAASALIAFLFAAGSLRMQANIFITGLAVNLFAGGLTALVSVLLFDTKGVVEFADFPELASLSLPLISRIPVIGAAFSDHSPFVYLSWLMVPAAAVVLHRTPFGLRVRTAGLGPQTLYARGVSSDRIRERTIVLSGIACGIAGASLSLELGSYVPHITAGRGWIALVAIYLGGKRPAGILPVALLFAAAEYVSYTAQGIQAVPSSLLLGFPFLITFLGMVVYSVYQHRRSTGSSKVQGMKRR
jgi:simple sugar transport system permease protein